MKLSPKSKNIIQHINGPALAYFAEKAGNKELYDLMNEGFDNVEGLAELLSLKQEYTDFFQKYSEALVAQNRKKADEIFDDFFFFLTMKICFPEGLD